MHELTTIFVRAEHAYRADRIRAGILGRRERRQRTSTPRLGHGDNPAAS